MKLILILLLLPFSLMAQSKQGVSNASKANEFINSLNASQKKDALFPFDEMNRYDWHYVPPASSPRTGISLKDLNAEQKRLAYALLQAFLSAQGYDKTKNIMSLESVLQVLEPNNKSRIPENYFVSMYGSPKADSVWGWKFTGHHVALNFTVIKDKIAFAPFFFGANPAIVLEGPRKGFSALKAEENSGFELLRSLTDEQKKKAIFQLEAFSDVVTTNSTKAAPLEPVGIPASELNAGQKALLNKVITTYLSSMPPAITKIRMNKIAKEGLNSLRFGWAGETVQGKPHYYRVQGKTFLIEFDNTQNNANHVHTVWRDFNGDYGRDLLREHYQNSPEHHH